MIPKQSPPFRAEHVGSLLRPCYLLEARKKCARNEITQEQLRKVEDQAVTEAIDIQREVGIKGITDGEYRRHMFYDGFFEHLQGIEVVENPPLDFFKLYVPSARVFTSKNAKLTSTMLCTHKIRHVKSGYVPQFEAIRKLVHPNEVSNIKITMVAPEWLHLRHGDHAYRPGVYTNREDYFDDIAAAYRQELDFLYAAGCRNIQIDDPTFAFFCDSSMLKCMRDEGTDPDSLLDAYIRLINNCLATRPQDMTISMHLCRGNFSSTHFSEGSYDTISERLFNDVNVDCYYLEYDTERAGTFEPLKHLPKHKSVVLGLITTKSPDLEDKTFLRERVFDAARIVASGTGETVDQALQRMSVSPQCGFASHEEGNFLSENDMKIKLQLVRDLAASIWEDA